MTHNPLLSTVRALRLVLHLIIGLLLALAVLLLRSRVPRDRLSRWWLSVLLDVFNIEVDVRGTPSAQAPILVANHISWLDIPVIAAQQQTRFVAKSDIRDWPIVGWLTTAAGSFYIRRGGNVTAALQSRIEPFLNDGGRLLFFPEGTTTDGREVGRFHARLFGLATETGKSIQPVALRYGKGANGTAVAPYVGDDALFWHILRLLREPVLRVEIDYCSPISIGNRDRKTLAGLAQAQIQAVVEADSTIKATPVAARLSALA